MMTGDAICVQILVMVFINLIWSSLAIQSSHMLILFSYYTQSLYDFIIRFVSTFIKWLSWEESSIAHWLYGQMVWICIMQMMLKLIWFPSWLLDFYPPPNEGLMRHLEMWWLMSHTLSVMDVDDCHHTSSHIACDDCQWHVLESFTWPHLTSG